MTDQIASQDDPVDLQQAEIRTVVVGQVAVSERVIECLLTRDEVALVLRKSPDTLDRLVKRREIAVVYVGSSPMFRPSDLEAYLDRQRRPVDTPTGRSRRR